MAVIDDLLSGAPDSALRGVPGIQRFTMTKQAVEATPWIK